MPLRRVINCRDSIFFSLNRIEQHFLYLPIATSKTNSKSPEKKFLLCFHFRFRFLSHVAEHRLISHSRLCIYVCQAREKQRKMVSVIGVLFYVTTELAPVNHEMLLLGGDRKWRHWVVIDTFAMSLHFHTHCFLCFTTISWIIPWRNLRLLPHIQSFSSTIATRRMPEPVIQQELVKRARLQSPALSLFATSLPPIPERFLTVKSSS